jgi:hypothetical protein
VGHATITREYSTHVNCSDLASAYIISPIPRPDLALEHLQYVVNVQFIDLCSQQPPRIATRLAPEDAEIAFNLAAVLEAVGRLEDALVTTSCHSVESCLMWCSEILQAEQRVWDRPCRDAHPQRKPYLLFLTSRLLPCWITGQCEDPWEEVSRRRGGPSLSVMV